LRSVVLLASFLASALGAQAQGTGSREPGTERRGAASPQLPAPSPQPPGSELTIYLMTMGPGDPVWERFGHNAIRIVDASRGTDSVYNWGTFDFAQPNFIGRFMTGNTEYWLQSDGMAETVAAYRYYNRSMWVQELDFKPAERAAVRDFIAWNAQPEHRYYRYDYYLDNCSTRVRDIIDRAVGGQLKTALTARLTNTTYRFHTQRALAPEGVVGLATNVALGELADRPISAWETAFLPEQLQEQVRSLQVKSADGTTHPLVKNEQQLFAAQRPALPASPPDQMVRNLAIGAVIAALLALLARAALAGRRVARIAFTTIATIWAAISGILGVALVIAWTATRHIFIGHNENILQFDPLSLILAVVLPLAIARGRAVGAALTLTRVIAVVSLLGLAMQLLPWFNQENGAVIALALPANLALAWAVAELTAQRAGAPRRSTASRRVVSRSAA
jgi:Domain of unknown function (DUF4105)